MSEIVFTFEKNHRLIQFHCMCFKYTYWLVKANVNPIYQF